MNRIVLAILALFAGLAAQVSPAEARVCGRVEIGATLGLKSAARTQAVAAAAGFRPQPQRHIEVLTPISHDLILPVKAAPAVQLRIDRSRE